MLRPSALSLKPTRSNGGNAAASPCASRWRARGIQLTASASMRCHTTSYADHVSGPSFSRVQGSGSPPSKASRTTGVRRRRLFVTSRSRLMGHVSPVGKMGFARTSVLAGAAGSTPAPTDAGRASPRNVAADIRTHPMPRRRARDDARRSAAGASDRLVLDTVRGAGARSDSRGE